MVVGRGEYGLPRLKDWGFIRIVHVLVYQAPRTARPRDRNCRFSSIPPYAGKIWDAPRSRTVFVFACGRPEKVCENSPRSERE